jgi:hypothetical protein
MLARRLRVGFSPPRAVEARRWAKTHLVSPAIGGTPMRYGSEHCVHSGYSEWSGTCSEVGITASPTSSKHVP